MTESNKKRSKTARDVFAFFLWAYAIIKLFVFDFDVYLIQTHIPNLWWLIKFKFVILVVLISIYWLTVGDKRFLKALLFLGLFPFYLLLWRIGRLVFRNWFTAFAVVGYVGSFLKTLKYNFLGFTLFCAASLLVLITDQPYLIILGIILLTFYLILHFSKRIFYAFVPSKAMVFPRDGIVKILTLTKEQFALPPEIKSTAIERFTTEQKSKWELNLQLLLLANRATTFTASKLREFQESRLIILYFIFGLLFTFFISVILFGVANLGLQKLDQAAFSSPIPRNIFFFVYYSFNTILTNGIADFYPISAYARLLNSAEVFFGIFIIVILFFMFTNIKSEKAKSEMDSLINAMNQQSLELESFINQEFSMDIERAITEVKKLPGYIVKIISYFTSMRPGNG